MYRSSSMRLSDSRSWGMALNRWVIIEAPRLTASNACAVVAVLSGDREHQSHTPESDHTKFLTHECPMLTTNPASFNFLMLPITPCNSGATVINLTIAFSPPPPTFPPLLLPGLLTLAAARFASPYISKKVSHPSCASVRLSCG
jgi:hypothetical protein